MRKTMIILFLLPFIGKGQITTPTWGVSDTLITIHKTTDFIAVHDYIEVFNYAGEDLNMRWICDEPPTWHPNWATNFGDTEVSTFDVEHNDSSDFVLLDPPEFANKLIIGVQHFSYAGHDTISFKIIPLDYPEDSIWVHYEIIIDQGEAWGNIEDSHLPYSVIQNENGFTLSGDGFSDVTVFNQLGQKVIVSEHYDMTSDELVSITESGFFYVWIEQENRPPSSFKLIIP